MYLRMEFDSGVGLTCFFSFWSNLDCKVHKPTKFGLFSLNKSNFELKSEKIGPFGNAEYIVFVTLKMLTFPNN